MLAVLRQEWIRRRFSILRTALLILFINVAFLIVLHMTSDGKASFDAGFMSLISSMVMFFDAAGILLIALCFSAGNMKYILKSDVGYLMKMIPVTSWELVGGKLLLGVGEMLVYATAAFLGLSLLTNLAPPTIYLGESGFWNMAADVSGLNMEALLKGLLIYAVLYISVMSVFNFARTLVAAFWKNRKFENLLSFIVIVTLVSLETRFSYSLNAAISGMDAYVIGNANLGIFLGFAAVFYVCTSLLWDEVSV